MNFARFAFSAIAILAATAALADSANLTPNKDATIFGTTTSGANGTGNVFVGNNSVPETRRGLLAFNLATIPAGSTVTNVTLQMFCVRAGASGGAQTLTLQKITANWSEGPSGGTGSLGGQPTTPAVNNDVTWNQRIVPGSNWTTAGGDFSATVSASQSVNLATASYTWGSTAQMVADVQGWVNNSSTNFGWMMRGSEVGTQTVKEFSSREESTTSQRPLLSVTYTPTAGVADWSMY